MAETKVNLKDLATASSVSSTDNLLIFNKSTNAASKVDFNVLSSASLGQIPTQIDGINTKIAYTTILSETTYSDFASVLAALDAYADSIGGQIRVVGYISTSNSLLLGLTNTSHFMDFYVNSANYRLLVARPVSGSYIYQISKQAGTWATAWKRFASVDETATNKSYTAATDSIDNIFTTGLYFIGNNVTGKPLGLTGNGTNGVLIVGGYGTQDANIMKIYIYASQTTDEKKGMYLRTFAGTTDHGWQHITTIEPITQINETLTNLTGSQATSVSNADFNDYTTPGVYQMGNLATMTNAPTSTGFGSLEVIKSRTYIFQRFNYMSPTTGATEYFRVSTDSGSTWRQWSYNATPTFLTCSVGNGDIMSFTTNTTHQIGNQVYINCGITFTGSRASNALLLRLPVSPSRTQYVHMVKISSGVQSAFVSSISAGSTDINCPTTFANGDRVYITGVITLV